MPSEVCPRAPAKSRVGNAPRSPGFPWPILGLAGGLIPERQRFVRISTCFTHKTFQALIFLKLFFKNRFTFESNYVVQENRTESNPKIIFTLIFTGMPAVA